jgi:hypothetical protein
MTVDIDQVEGLDDSVAVLPAGLVEAVADQVQCCITVRSRMGVIAPGSPLCPSLTVMSRFLRSGSASRGRPAPRTGRLRRRRRPDAAAFRITPGVTHLSTEIGALRN